MAKTRRRKTNASPRKAFGNAKAVVIEQGFRINCNGHRDIENGMMKTQPNKDAKPVFIARQYTGVPRGKTYPYAGAKRGGGSAGQA